MPKPYNFIFFQSDNHNRDLLGCYGDPLVKTPNLDRIAQNGVRFTNAYAASALCCPARASIATGRFPHQTRFWDNAIVYDGSVPSWMHRIRESGCEVVSIGKLHYRSSEDDNGFSEEILPMHIVNKKGGIAPLLRSIGEEQFHHGQWELYQDRSGIGSSYYQDFDQKITEEALKWLRQKNDRVSSKPWVLHVSYPSSHPPFSISKSLYEMYPLEEISLPPLFSKNERPEHPALQHLRETMGWGNLEPEILKKIITGYYGLITHLDQQIGLVLEELQKLGMGDNTRVLYTTDHGEMCGSHGLLGKCNLYEGSIAVPLIMSGPGIPEGEVVEQIVSHTDIFPTLVEGMGASLKEEDDDLPGTSLWPSIQGAQNDRFGFAEYHAAGSKNASFMYRENHMKLIYHVDMPPQLFDLKSDPQETRDLLENPDHSKTLIELTKKLKEFCDPEKTDQLAKSDQKQKMEFWGGREKVMSEGSLVITPPPGIEAEIVTN